jgi:hypothetical protein
MEPLLIIVPGLALASVGGVALAGVAERAALERAREKKTSCDTESRKVTSKPGPKSAPRKAFSFAEHQREWLAREERKAASAEPASAPQSAPPPPQNDEDKAAESFHEWLDLCIEVTASPKDEISLEGLIANYINFCSHYSLPMLQNEEFLIALISNQNAKRYVIDEDTMGMFNARFKGC